MPKQKQTYQNGPASTIAKKEPAAINEWEEERSREMDLVSREGMSETNRHLRWKRE